MPVVTGDSSVAAIVLAAGKSSRMGSQKQLLRLGEKTLLEHTTGNVRSSGISQIVLVLGSGAEAIQQQIKAKELKIVVNEGFEEGMGTSLQRGLEALAENTTAALIVLADQPLVKSQTMRELVKQYQLHKPQILIPTYRGFRGNPVLVDRSVFPEIAALNGDMGCRAIFGDHLQGILRVPVDDIGILLDIDQKEDLALVRQAHSSGEYSIAVSEGPVLDASKPELLIVGRETLAIALAKFARLLDFSITIVDPLLELKDFPDADLILRILDFSDLPPNPRRAIVVASQGRFDEEAIEQAILAGAPYVALVANKRRAQEVRRSLELRNIAPEKLEAVHSPAGLSIGARSPAEIALSIMAQIAAEQNKA
jgi:molybdenum cofactor cytidylyltransferase